MEGSGRLGGYEQVGKSLPNWEKLEKRGNRTGVRFPYFGNKKLSTYFSTAVDNSIRTFLIFSYILI